MRTLNKGNKTVLITNIPAPYRIPVFNLIAEKYSSDFTVIYCSRREPDREWNLPELKHNCIFLKERVKNKNGKFVHNNPDIFKYLNKIKPSVVITTGFNPTFLYAFLWSKIHFKKYIPMTDGTIFSESFLTWKHRIIRKIVYKLSSFFIGASNGAKELYISYNVPENKIFRSPLCIDNMRFGMHASSEKKYDIMFSGRFVDRKMPPFFSEVVRKLKSQKNDLKVLIIGSGPLKNKFLEELNINRINYDYPGFIMQEDLPKYYASSKILLFPTQYDPWGIVANEACAVGTPVITCSNAGAADDLIINDVNGFVIPLDCNLWVEKILELLYNNDLYQKMSQEALRKVQEYSYDIAAKGIVEAIGYALGGN